MFKVELLEVFLARHTNPASKDRPIGPGNGTSSTELLKAFKEDLEGYPPCPNDLAYGMRILGHKSRKCKEGHFWPVVLLPAIDAIKRIATPASTAVQCAVETTSRFTPAEGTEPIPIKFVWGPTAGTPAEGEVQGTVRALAKEVDIARARLDSARTASANALLELETAGRELSRCEVALARELSVCTVKDGYDLA